MNIMTLTRSIAILPDLAREVAGFARWDFGRLLAILADEDEDEGEGCDHDHDHGIEPWQAGRHALEFLMLMLGSDEMDEETFNGAMHAAVGEIDNPMLAVNVIMALSGMLASVADDDDVAMISRALLEAEARSE